ncbi:hypothetical protein SEA_LABELLE_89 [Mycobacterium phage Labelle]|nr:hypothetical protein SEA_LABELLE_89 [Mycobacterium phage Labelle]
MANMAKTHLVIEFNDEDRRLLSGLIEKLSAPTTVINNSVPENDTRPNEAGFHLLVGTLSMIGSELNEILDDPDKDMFLRAKALRELGTKIDQIKMNSLNKIEEMKKERESDGS